MGKKRNLNGLPNNLVQRYFSTLFYWRTGYMPDWIWYAAQEKSIVNIEIDILNGTVYPEEMQFNAITAQLPKLAETITNTLDSNGFNKEFIVEAKIYIIISQDKKQLSGAGKIKDIDGRIYEGKSITENAYNKPFSIYPKNKEVYIKNSQELKVVPRWWQLWK